MKKTFLWILLMVGTSVFGQTPQVYSYICNYAVNTGTGERRPLGDPPLYFNCRFNADKSICYECNKSGKLKIDIDKEKVNTTNYGCFNVVGRYEYRYQKTTNGVLIYVGEFSYYSERRYDLQTGNWIYSDFEKEGPFYLYFAPDYSRLNKPIGENEVFVYERYYPDQYGQPSQIW